MSRQNDTYEALNSISDEQIETIKELAGSIKFGQVTLVIQDGVLVQIETTRKLRMR